MTSLNIHQRLHAIMEDVSYVQKENKKVNNQYTFVSHDAVTSKVRPSLLKHGVLVIPSYFDISVDGNRTNCSMSITFINIDKPDDKIEIPCAGFGQGIDPQDKGAGKAMSYAYKYALLKVLGLETGDDPERDNIEQKPKKSKPELTPEEKRKAAEEWVNDYLVKLDKIEDLDVDLVMFQTKNNAMLKRISEGYENLYKTIVKATNKKRGIIESPSGLE